MKRTNEIHMDSDNTLGILYLCLGDSPFKLSKPAGWHSFSHRRQVNHTGTLIEISVSAQGIRLVLEVNRDFVLILCTF
jgi:hypothetical protein